MTASSLEEKWAPILAESESEVHVLAQGTGPDPTKLGKDQTFFAICNFRGWGELLIEEKFDTAGLDPLVKYVEITGSLGGLCPS